ncbi:transposase InsO family protein [Rhizobium sp. SG570]|nr:transposase InsO family protein [Rhizobium sp. SG570]
MAVVLDAFSRKVIGWAIATHLKAELAIEALDTAVGGPPPPPPPPQKQKRPRGPKNEAPKTGPT